MHSPKQSKLVIVSYLVVLIYWIITFITGTKFSQANYIYQFIFGLIPLLGGIGGLLNAKQWGGLRSGLGKALFFLSLGLITWGLGQMVWSYYVIFKDAEIPYPSLADLGYVLSLPFWSIGIVNLSKATGARFGLKRPGAKPLAILLPVAVTAISYYLLIVIARQGELFPEIETSMHLVKTVLDVGYPLGDVVILTLALLVFGLSVSYLGGRYKKAIFALLAGFVVMYFADFSFSYTTNAETYYNGHWVDLLFPTAMALLAYGVNSIRPPRAQPSQPNQPAPEIATGQALAYSQDNVPVQPNTPYTSPAATVSESPLPPVQQAPSGLTPDVPDSARPFVSPATPDKTDPTIPPTPQNPPLNDGEKSDE